MKIKNILLPLCCCLFLVFLLTQTSKISNLLTKVIEPKEQTMLKEKSPYTKQDNFLYVQNATSFLPLSKDDLKNIFYTIVNSGWKSFTFYCPTEYTACISDMKELSQNQDVLTHINNYVHPYLSFSNIKTSISENGEITIQVDYLYQEKQILAIEKELDLYMSTQNSNEEVYDKIKDFHDYIINKTKYDINRNEVGSSTYSSYIAYGPIIEGYATCNGYTDIMAIFLSRLQIKNYKIATTPAKNQSSTEGHVWNAVYINNEWVHLDLTWDDPVSKNGEDYLQHKYFLITNEELKKADEGEVEVLEHHFNSAYYREFLNK